MFLIEISRNQGQFYIIAYELNSKKVFRIVLNSSQGQDLLDNYGGNLEVLVDSVDIFDDSLVMKIKDDIYD